MPVWWWLLVTFHLVCGNQEVVEDLYDIETNPNSSEDNLHEDIIQPDSSFISDSAPTRRKRSIAEYRDVRQPKFHSWGGKRYGEDEEEDYRKNDVLNNENDNYIHPYYHLLPTQLNYSKGKTEKGEEYMEQYIKRMKQQPSFSSWGGKRDPEVVNEVDKKSDLYNSILQDEKAKFFSSEQNNKRYPAFNSWAGKRTTAFNSWGGKRAAAFNSWGGKRAAAFNSWGGKRAAAFNSWGGKRTAGNNNWEGKRAAAFNSWGGKRAAAFNSWGGKRAAAFNSWGGKRTTGFNNWGGKRAAAFNSWGGKRASAFNSWGGKRASPFNSWGGKRAAAFNSWGGKKSAAFNSWGGKRAAAFNSWGGKRAAAFNSWGGKRDFSVQPQNSSSYNNEDIEIASLYNNIAVQNSTYLPHNINDGSINVEDEDHPFFDNTSEKSPVNYFNSRAENILHPSSIITDKLTVTTDNDNLKSNPVYSSTDAFVSDITGPLGSEIIQQIKQSNTNNQDLTKIGDDDDNQYRYNNGIYQYNDDLISTSDDKIQSQLIKREKNVYFKMQPRYPGFSSWAGKRNYQIKSKENRIRPISTAMTKKRSPLFSSWYGNKIPTLQLSNGKRRPAFSSWGGKRSEFKKEEEDDCLDCSLKQTSHESSVPELTDFDEIDTNTQSAEDNTFLRKKRDTTCTFNCRNKRSNENVKKTPVITRMFFQGGVAWPMLMKSLPKGADFYAWGGKRSS